MKRNAVEHLLVSNVDDDESVRESHIWSTLRAGQPSVKHLELHADFMAGYFAARHKEVKPDYPAAQFALSQYNGGDDQFWEREVDRTGCVAVIWRRGQLKDSATAASSWSWPNDAPALASFTPIGTHYIQHS